MWMESLFVLIVKILKHQWVEPHSLPTLYIKKEFFRIYCLSVFVNVVVDQISIIKSFLVVGFNDWYSPDCS